jgi:PAS domain S-box-containing protein
MRRNGNTAVGVDDGQFTEWSESQFARLAAIVESSSDAIYGWSIDGTITSWNQGAVQLFGYRPEEIIGQSLLVLIPPGGEKSAFAQRDTLLQGRAVEPFDTERMRKDGAIVEVSMTVSSVRSPLGDVVAGASIARDNSARRRAEEALRASEERTRGIIESARDAYVGFDDHGLLTDWNHSAELAFGWSRDEVIGRSLADLIIPPELRGSDDAGLLRHQAIGLAPVLDGRVEMTVRHRDGHQFPIEVTIWQVGAHTCQHFGAFIQDITGRKRNEAELRRTASLLAATLEATADGVFVSDLRGEAISFNSHFADMWSMPDEHRLLVDMAKGMAFAVQLLEDPEGFLASTGAVFAQPDADYHDTLRFKDGQVLERTSFPQRVDGVVVGRVWNFHDVTERNRLEADLAAARDQALESSRLKSDFLATMSHEIRTPMNGVIGLTGLLLDSELSDTQRQYADGVRASGEALLGIINDILDFSKIEAGKLELEMVDFDLAQALDDVAFLVAESARSKGLELVAYCDPDMPTMVRGDVGRLRQILLNLASNAVKFTATGEVVIRASLGHSDDAARVGVRLEVVDTGIGVAPESAERLFEPFSQADASTTRRYGGTGLGLAISRQLTEAMGGTIGVDSEPGRGSVFWINLCLGMASKPVTPVDTACRLPHGLRVLVVDDNQTNRLVLGSQLLAWDLAADLAPDAYVALDHLRHAAAEGHPYDLALVDMAMPGMDGMELGRIVSADPALRSVQLLLLTSVSVGSAEAAGAGFSKSLTKPARLSQLYEAMVRTVTPVAAKEAPLGNPVTPPVPAGSRGRLLIVEDNAINQAVARAMVAKLGYSCDVAGNGIEALAASNRRHYDAVLMDCQMPEMDGYEATAEIRREEAGEARVPIIAMTAGALVQDRDRCLAAGMDDYLAKPVKARELEGMLARWLPSVPDQGIPEAEALPGPRKD